MTALEGFIEGLHIAFEPGNVLLILAGSLIGLLIRVLPGIRAIHGVAILMPLAYAVRMPVETMLIFLVSCYCGTVCVSRVADIMNTEGNEASQASGTLLSISIFSSFGGLLLAVFYLTVSVLLMQVFAIRLSPSEYFILIVFALATVSVRAGRYPVKTLVSTCTGLMLATVGIDSTTGVLRFTFSEPQFYDGIEFSTVVIGLFAISQAFILLEQLDSHGKGRFLSIRPAETALAQVFGHRWIMFRASALGFLVGVVPGFGTSIGSSIALKAEQRLTRKERGNDESMVRRIISEEASNSAAAGGTLVPTLALGIPGSGTTSILLGALMLYNISPGPILFLQHADIVWAIAISILIAGIFLLAVNLIVGKWLFWFNRLPYWVLAPSMLVLSFIGCFAVNGSNLSLFLLIAFGGLGYAFEKLDYPLIPVLLGFVLGELMEDNLRRALAISGGDIGILFSSPLGNALWVLSLIVFSAPFLIKIVKSNVKP